MEVMQKTGVDLISSHGLGDLWCHHYTLKKWKNLRNKTPLIFMVGRKQRNLISAQWACGMALKPCINALNVEAVVALRQFPVTIAAVNVIKAYGTETEIEKHGNGKTWCGRAWWRHNSQP
ncbi:Uncharacterized protein Fot_53416 [Forsythia ovata]|uniref:Uncharacterized protein n=1 Tax=Forsythia ovata TaxID=205694 RepID=A0ABD1PIL7_9LAMI